MAGLRIGTQSLTVGDQIHQVFRVEINNIENGNSFGPEESIALMDLIESKAFRKASALVWTNEAGFPFCRGGNLKYYSQLEGKQKGLKTNREIRSSLTRLSQLEIPTLAIVRGDSFGGGMELLSCFDFVLSTPSALFGYWQRRVGLTFGWGGGARLESRVGLKAVRQLAFEARSLTAYEALSLGLIDQILPTDLAEERALEKLGNLLGKSASAGATAKLWKPESEQKSFEKLWHSPEHLEALKRKRG